eukprot:CAMPEP_0180235434 /NCGR_PEP_ID=MMETSP0987-20121128/29211_1 /TAXON_ID=697907 /ORGANISM="non described non described, Strain CCMP2293" /LENGTH=174 /DNA_ID=CAMNT_0022201527 /DNA_START=85 /DNA_END=605 /DNA_ORIENTATION=+
MSTNQVASMAMLQSSNMRQQDGQVSQAQQLPVPSRLGPAMVGSDFGRVASSFGGLDGPIGAAALQNFDRTASLTTGGQATMDFSRLQGSAGGPFHGFDPMNSFMPSNMAGAGGMFERTSSSNANDAFQRVGSMNNTHDLFKRVSSLGGDAPIPQTPMSGMGGQVPGAGGMAGVG